jgi:peptide/nickel transport system permease protein
VAMRALGTRLLQLVPIMFLVSVASFVLVDLLPGDPAIAILGENATPETIEALHEQLHLDESWFERYGRWVGDAITGDLGTSITSHRPVVDEFIERAPVTGQLAVMAIVFGLVVGIPLGLFAAHKQGRLADRAASTGSFAFVSLPPFILGLLLVYVLALRIEIFPNTGWTRIGEGFGENLKHAFLPALSVGLAELAVFTQLLRADAIQTLGEDFVLAARAKGMPTRHVLVHHALKPSSFSLITLAAVNFGRLLGGTVIVEQLFGLPGIGRYVVQAIPSKNMPVIQGSVLILATVYLVLNTLADLSYNYLDPRLRRAAV